MYGIIFSVREPMSKNIGIIEARRNKNETGNPS